MKRKQEEEKKIISSGDIAIKNFYYNKSTFSQFTLLIKFKKHKILCSNNNNSHIIRLHNFVHFYFYLNINFVFKGFYYSKKSVVSN